MSRPRSGIGAELAPLVLILAALAGSLALIVAVHWRASQPKAPRPPVALAPSPSPPAPKPLPIAIPAPTPVAEPEPEPDEPEPPPPPAPEDPTPKVLAKLTAEEAGQLLEASKADRRATALEEARRAAQLESERWRRRNSLARLQLDSLDAKVRKIETEADELALERDALEKEVDARKAMASQARSRPSTAILPHRGQNGTWRRPIVIECANGMATLQPQGIGFGLLELGSGFGPASNPFVAAVAREAIRIQGSHSPDGQSVTPYIFFLVRPDGIRAYYEARGRLEPLGITFGYELADQEWEIDFPDLDDLKAWDGSPSTGLPDSTPKKIPRPPGGFAAEDDDFRSFELPRRSAAALRNGAGGDFAWPRTSRAIAGAARPPVQQGLEPMKGAPTPRSGGLRFSNSSDNRGIKPVGTGDGGDQDVAARVGLGGSGDGSGGGSAQPIFPPGSGSSISPLPPGEGPGVRDGASPASLENRPIPRPGGDPTTLTPALSRGEREEDPGTGAKATTAKPSDDPANSFVWPARPASGPAGKPAGRPSLPGPDSPDPSPPVRHVGPFSRPLAMGLDPVPPPNAPPAPRNPVNADPTRPDGPTADPSNPDPSPPSTGGGVPGPRGSAGSPSDIRGIGQGGAPNVQPPPGSIGVGMPGIPADGSPPADLAPPADLTPPPGQPNLKRPAPLPEVRSGSVVDRRFEVVLVCGPKGVIVQPGAYRVTTDALKDRDGLLKKQVVALVKAKRTADTSTVIEPRARFLVQPGGEKNYWTARGQFLMSGLDWPMTTQVAESNQLAILPSESW